MFKKCDKHYSFKDLSMERKQAGIGGAAGRHVLGMKVDAELRAAHPAVSDVTNRADSSNMNGILSSWGPGPLLCEENVLPRSVIISSTEEGDRKRMTGMAVAFKTDKQNLFSKQPKSFPPGFLKDWRC